MNPNPDFLNILQTDVEAILKSTPALKDAVILSEDLGDLEAAIVAKIASRNPGETGKSGLGIVVLPVEVVDAESNLPGPPLKVRVKVQMIEHYVTNRDVTTGTRLKTDAACLHALGALHHQGMGGHALYAERNPISWLKVRPGFGSHVLTLYCRANGLTGPGKPSAVTAQLLTAGGTLSIAGIIPSAPDLLEAGSRNGRPLYTEDGTPADGQPSTYHSGTRWVIWQSEDISWQAAPGNEATPDLASGWAPVATVPGGIQITGTVSPAMDGFYPLAGTQSGRSRYASGSSDVSWSGSAWVMYHPTGDAWYGYDDVLTPDGVTVWTPWDDESRTSEGQPVVELVPPTPYGSPSLALSPSTSSSLELSCSTPGAEIRYTLDGSYPTPADGLLYDSPIPDLEVGTMIRAAAYAPDLNPGDLTEITILI